MKKYQLPEFLEGVITQEKYERWLQRKSIAHVRRDKRRGNSDAKNVEYKIAIHDAIIQSKGLDAYTKEELDWSLLGKWDNEEAKKRGRHHKREFYRLPSVDHIGDGRSEEHTSELQSLAYLVCRLLLEKKKKKKRKSTHRP